MMQYEDRNEGAVVALGCCMALGFIAGVVIVALILLL